jgi:hypothetical protein
MLLLAIDFDELRELNMYLKDEARSVLDALRSLENYAMTTQYF